MDRRQIVWMVSLALLCLLGAVGLYALLQTDFVLWLAHANQWLADTFIRRMGYWGVFALMFVESSLVPFPSEIIVPPAADLARRLPDWSVTWVVVMGTAGSLGGALFNYALALYLGRPLLLRFIARYGTYLHLSTAGYDRAETLFQEHGAVSTFTGRLIPGIRQLISLPAGLARMPLPAFCVLTSLGAGIWVAVLAWLGYQFGANAELLAAQLRQSSRWVVLGALALVAAYVALHLMRRRRASAG